MLWGTRSVGVASTCMIRSRPRRRAAAAGRTSARPAPRATAAAPDQTPGTGPAMYVYGVAYQPAAEKIAPRTEIPNTPPSSRIVLFAPEARRESRSERDVVREVPPRKPVIPSAHPQPKGGAGERKLGRGAAIRCQYSIERRWNAASTGRSSCARTSSVGCGRVCRDFVRIGLQSAHRHADGQPAATATATAGPSATAVASPAPTAGPSATAAASPTPTAGGFRARVAVFRGGRVLSSVVVRCPHRTGELLR